MQLEIAQLCCPLCKRQLPANSSEHTLPTRLCESCQTLVLSAFRRPNSNIASASVVAQGNGVATPTSAQDNALSADQGVNGVPAFDINEGNGSAFDDELRPPFPFDAPDTVKFDLFNDVDPNDRMPTARTHSNVFSDNGARQSEKLFEGFVHSVSVADPEYVTVADSTLIVQPAGIIEAPVDSPAESEDLTYEPNQERNAETIPEEVVADPWAAPLAAWDYSQSEWPVLVGPAKRRSFKTVRWAIAAVAVLASAAAFYFLVYSPANPQRPATTDAGATTKAPAGEPQLAANGSAGSAAVAQTQSDKSGPAPPAAAGSLQPADTGESAQGQFSLQAASFPTQDGADEFAEKLKRAGVPSFVVPADLAKRGKWFRVRVGRFDTAENAQRFAGEAQQRARAAGLALQLIVCQHDQP